MTPSEPHTGWLELLDTDSGLALRLLQEALAFFLFLQLTALDMVDDGERLVLAEGDIEEAFLL